MAEEDATTIVEDRPKSSRKLAHPSTIGSAGVDSNFEYSPARFTETRLYRLLLPAYFTATLVYPELNGRTNFPVRELVIGVAFI